MQFGSFFARSNLGHVVIQYDFQNQRPETFVALWQSVEVDDIEILSIFVWLVPLCVLTLLGPLLDESEIPGA